MFDDEARRIAASSYALLTIMGTVLMTWIKNKSCDAFSFTGLGGRRRKRFRRTNMTTLKTLTIVAALLAGGTSLAIAQNGPATGGQRPVAGGANGGGWAGGWWYGGAPVYGYRHLYAYYPHYRHYRYRHY